MANDISVVKLASPIRNGDTQVSEVTVRRPKVRDLRAIDKARTDGGSEMDQGVAMAAALCDLPVSVIDDMDAADFARVSEAVAGFLPQPQKAEQESGEAS